MVDNSSDSDTDMGMDGLGTGLSVSEVADRLRGTVAREVLETVYELSDAGQAPSTSLVAKRVKPAQDTQSALSSLYYHLNEYLEPAGLIERHYPSDDTGGRGRSPSQLVVTDRGVRVVESLRDMYGYSVQSGSDTEALQDEIESIENRVVMIDQELQTVVSELDNTVSREELDEVEQTVDELERVVGKFRRSGIVGDDDERAGIVDELTAVQDGLERLEYRINSMEQSVAKADKRGQRLDALEQRIKAIESDPVIEDEDVRKRIDRQFILAVVFRKLIQNEAGMSREEFAQFFQEKKDAIDHSTTITLREDNA